MALLETALDAVEFGLVKMVAIVCRREGLFCCLGLAAPGIHAIKATGRNIWLVLLFQHFCEWTSRKSEAGR